MLRTTLRTAPITCHAQRQRAFFSLPKYTAADRFAHDEPGTQSYHEQKIFPYRRSELYKVIADVESYSNFLPYCTESRILRSKAQQDGVTVMEAELTVGFLAFRESYVSAVTCRPDEFVEAVASSSSSLFKTLTATWHLQPVSSFSSRLSLPVSQDVFAESIASQTPVDQGPTLVSLDITFAFANPLHATVSTTFFGQVVKLMAKSFEERCIALHGPRTD